MFLSSRVTLYASPTHWLRESSLRPYCGRCACPGVAGSSSWGSWRTRLGYYSYYSGRSPCQKSTYAVGRESDPNGNCIFLILRPCKKNYLFIIRKNIFNGEGGHFLFLFFIFKKSWFFQFLLRLRLSGIHPGSHSHHPKPGS